MVIAKIKLSPGNAGWYDPTTGIHLTIARPIAEVKAGMNLNRIRSGLAYHTIQLIDGSVAEEEVISKVEQQIQEAIQKLQVNVDEVVGDVSAMQDTVGGIKNDVSQMKGDVDEIQTNVNEMKADVDEIQGDVTEIQGDVNEMQTTVGQIHEEVTKDTAPTSLNKDETKKVRKTATKRKKDE